MTISAITSHNGKARRSLAAELDRLDQMLDGLADGLNDAVGEAVKSSVNGHLRETIQVVLTELFTNPEVLAKLRAVVGTTPDMTPPAPQPRRGLQQRLPSLWTGVRNALRRLRQLCAFKIQRQWQRIRAFGRGIRLGLVLARRQLPMVRPFRRQLLTAFLCGVAVGVMAWFAGLWVASLASGTGGFITALAAQAGLWFWKMLRRTQCFMYKNEYMA